MRGQVVKVGLLLLAVSAMVAPVASAAPEFPNGGISLSDVWDAIIDFLGGGDGDYQEIHAPIDGFGEDSGPGDDDPADQAPTVSIEE
jgi:hypothetical protein